MHKYLNFDKEKGQYHVLQSAKRKRAFGEKHQTRAEAHYQGTRGSIEFTLRFIRYSSSEDAEGKITGL